MESAEELQHRLDLVPPNQRVERFLGKSPKYSAKIVALEGKMACFNGLVLPKVMPSKNNSFTVVVPNKLNKEVGSIEIVIPAKNFEMTVNLAYLEEQKRIALEAAKKQKAGPCKRI